MITNFYPDDPTTAAFMLGVAALCWVIALLSCREAENSLFRRCFMFCFAAVAFIMTVRGAGGLSFCFLRHIALYLS